MVFKIIGGLLVAWGVADVGGSWMGIDVWADWLGVQLEGVFYQFSGWAALIIGFFVFNFGSSDDEDTAEE